ncbi:MAG: nickel pincer cofactor biosynthesis protein LarB, partial [Loigolactobacillus coryniformis]|nr:nickel pincer cofactor biosynthesis protein LarB [Loigolactobacillus coryniformis]
VTYYADARCAVLGPALPATESYIAVVTAGTSEIPVAEEAAITAETYGNRVERIYDVGVAGIQRLFNRLDVIRGAKVVIVIAGMEGALASVVGGLIDKPLIAVPTSVGYGTNFQGLTALLTMLNSCASGITVVNVDNGFGAAYSASMINHL